ncbi:hypothetical protein KJ590_01565 [Patescibacteria group bacterium]|nr:hypothetical protein [Patescibacteria group bacterium]MBU4142669.1 hypothetical protein [Patescibacteria group bacterium]
MKKDSFIAAIVVIVVSFLLLPVHSFAGGAVKPLEKAEKPVWQVGDTWVYEVSRTGELQDKKFKATMTVIEITDKGYAVAVDYGGEKTIEYYNKNINFVRATDEKGGMVETCAPEIPVFKWPLEPGKWWKGEYLYQDNKTSGSGSVSMTTEVIGPETLINGEGQEIATLKLVSKRANRYGTFVGKRDLWYDPQTRFIIKRVDERSLGKREERSLISFTPGTK